VPLREVSPLTSEGNYVRLLWRSRNPCSRARLEQRLELKLFFRANRRQIFDVNFVASVDSAWRDGCTNSCAMILRWKSTDVRRDCFASEPTYRVDWQIEGTRVIPKGERRITRPP
jgi:hypothetical protein